MAKTAYGSGTAGLGDPLIRSDKGVPAALPQADISGLGTTIAHHAAGLAKIWVEGEEKTAIGKLRFEYGKFMDGRINKGIPTAQRIQDKYGWIKEQEEAGFDLGSIMSVVKERGIKKTKTVTEGGVTHIVEPTTGEILGSSADPADLLMKANDGIAMQVYKLAEGAPRSYRTFEEAIMRNLGDDPELEKQFAQVSTTLASKINNITQHIDRTLDNIIYKNAPHNIQDIKDGKIEAGNIFNGLRDNLISYIQQSRSFAQLFDGSDSSITVSKMAMTQLISAVYADIHQKFADNPELYDLMGVTAEKMREWETADVNEMKEFTNYYSKAGTLATFLEKREIYAGVKRVERAIKNDAELTQLEAEHPTLYKVSQADKFGLYNAMSRIVESSKSLGDAATARQIYGELLNPVTAEFGELRLREMERLKELQKTGDPKLTDGYTLAIKMQPLLNPRLMIAAPQLQDRIVNTLKEIIGSLPKESATRKRLESQYDAWLVQITDFRTLWDARDKKIG
jgi:hypothetical protein